MHPSQGRLSRGRQHDACYVVWAVMLSAVGLIFHTLESFIFQTSNESFSFNVYRMKASYQMVQYEYLYRYTLYYCIYVFIFCWGGGGGLPVYLTIKIFALHCTIIFIILCRKKKGKHLCSTFDFGTQPCSWQICTIRFACSIT